MSSPCSPRSLSSSRCPPRHYSPREAASVGDRSTVARSGDPHRADDYAVTGALTVVLDGTPVRIDGVKISLRGHTSRRETECDFPKLKIAFPAGPPANVPLFAGLNSIKLGDALRRGGGRHADAEIRPPRQPTLSAARGVCLPAARRRRRAHAAGPPRDDHLSRHRRRRRSRGRPLVRHALVIEDHGRCGEAGWGNAGDRRDRVLERAGAVDACRHRPPGVRRSDDRQFRLVPEDDAATTPIAATRGIRSGTSSPRIAAADRVVPLIYDSTSPASSPAVTVVQGHVHAARSRRPVQRPRSK